MTEKIGTDGASAMAVILARAEERMRREADERWDRFIRQITWLFSAAYTVVIVMFAISQFGR